jgi:hypothetical protein
MYLGIGPLSQLSVMQPFIAFGFENRLSVSSSLSALCGSQITIETGCSGLTTANPSIAATRQSL